MNDEMDEVERRFVRVEELEHILSEICEYRRSGQLLCLIRELRELLWMDAIALDVKVQYKNSFFYMFIRYLCGVVRYPWSYKKNTYVSGGRIVDSSVCNQDITVWRNGVHICPGLKYRLMNFREKESVRKFMLLKKLHA